MMKLVLFLPLVLMLTCTAEALQCVKCSDLQCANTTSETCSTSAGEQLCMTAAILEVTNSTGVTMQERFKACVPAALCNSTVGPRNFSLDVGFSSFLTFANCCNTDNCNSANLSFPVPQASNSLQCFSCQSTTQCGVVIQCSGIEDRCFSGTVMTSSRSVMGAGCTSANLCPVAAQVGVLPFGPTFVNLTSGPNCCGTSLCNPLNTTSTNTTASNTTVTATGDACSVQLSVLHLLFALSFFMLC